MYVNSFSSLTFKEESRACIINASALPLLHILYVRFFHFKNRFRLKDWVLMI